MLRKLFRRQINLNVPETHGSSESTSLLNDKQRKTSEPQLLRHLSLISLVFLGVSNSIGSGVYVLTGIASNPHAGPFVTISYVIAGIACLITAFCYAEFASRVKDTSGSTYSFVYYSLGELAGFIVGWWLFTGAVASISATAITWSSYLDAFTNNTVKNFVINDLHAEWSHLGAPFSSYLDVSAIFITTILFLISLLGIKVATVFNNTLAIINIALLVIISVAGFIYGDFSNLTKAPFTGGFGGIIKGSSIVFYAFIGFESSTFAINESINPARNIPLSLIIAIVIITLTYCGASMSLILMQPFNEIDISASYPTAFDSIPWMKVVVSIGPLISLAAALYIATYGIARMGYSMAKDGLIFKFLSAIHPKTNIPHLATLLSLAFTLLLTLTLDIQNLIGFANISGFLMYSFIGVGLLVVRYFHDDFIPIHEENSYDINQDHDILYDSISSNDNLLNRADNRKNTLGKRIQNACSKYRFFRSKYNAVIVVFFVFFSNILFFGLMNHIDDLQTVFLIIGLISNLVSVIVLSLFKQTDRANMISFRVPLVPLLPVIVIMMNNYLLMSCEGKDWLVFAVLTLSGLPIYFFYGIRKSVNPM